MGEQQDLEDTEGLHWEEHFVDEMHGIEDVGGVQQDAEDAGGQQHERIPECFLEMLR